MLESDDSSEKNQIRQLKRIQRRVLGTLVEKGLTTPDQYPLTLKSVTTGCNQKSNRSPVSSYSEDEVVDALEELREMGLVAEVYTDSGRAPRYRHYTRVKFDFSETQLAIMTELLLRGRQQLGELRSRASRMTRIADQAALKEDLKSLQQMGYVQANGSLDRRGVEVDHALYLDGEKMAIGTAPADEPDDVVAESNVSPPAAPTADHSSSAKLSELDNKIERMQNNIDDLERRLSQLEAMLR